MASLSGLGTWILDWSEEGTTRFENVAKRRKRKLGALLIAFVAIFGGVWVVAWNWIVTIPSLGINQSMILPTNEIAYNIVVAAAAGILAVLARITYFASFSIMAGLLSATFAIGEVWRWAFIFILIALALQVADQWRLFFRVAPPVTPPVTPQTP